MKYPWMPLFWGDFLANTMHLSAQEAGAYLFLIAHAWEHEGKIEVRRLQRVSRVSNYQWPKIRTVLMQFFDSNMDPNFWIHHRVNIELTNAAELSNKRKAAALQMHSKRNASASVLHVHPPSQSHIESSANAQTRSAPAKPSSKCGPASALPTGAPARSDGPRKETARSGSSYAVNTPATMAELERAKLDRQKSQLGISPDQGMDYRSPPPLRPEHAHALEPLTDRPMSRNPAIEKILGRGNRPATPETDEEILARYAALAQPSPCSTCNCPKSASGETICLAKANGNPMHGKHQNAHS